MDRFRDAGLYFVTSEGMSRGRATLDIVRAALAGGVRLIQLREKEMSIRHLLDLARSVRVLTADSGAFLIINDHIDVALSIGADGVHLGQRDFPVADARKIAPDFIIGASSHSVEEARAAEAEGASYVNIGPLFPTQTKQWNDNFLGLEGLKRIAPAVNIPFTVMGGIKKCHIPDLIAAGAETIALVTAVTAAQDPKRAAQELLQTISIAKQFPCMV